MADNVKFSVRFGAQEVDDKWVAYYESPKGVTVVLLDEPFDNEEESLEFAKKKATEKFLANIITGMFGGG